MRRFFTYLFFGLLLLLIAFFGAVYSGVFGKLPTPTELANIQQQQASLVYSTDGQILGKFFVQNRTNIPFNELPPQLVQALVSTEDARFWDHQGVDFRATLRVLVKSVLLADRSAGGGSTLSQQLAKNLYGRQGYGKLTMPVAKTREIIIAGRLERVYSKEQLLELYLNTVPFGEDVYGIEAAALRYFGRSTQHLNLPQSASLVGMLKANTAYNPRLYPDKAMERRNVVLRQMQKAGHLTEAAWQQYSDAPLGLAYTHPEIDGPAPYFLEEVKREAKRIISLYNAEHGTDWQLDQDGLRIKTSLHAGLQQLALSGMQQHLSRMQPLLNQQYASGSSAKALRAQAERALKRAGVADTGKSPRTLFSWSGVHTPTVSALDSAMQSLQLLHAGMVAIEPRTGAIRLWVGGIDFRTHPYDQVRAHRQTASTFKPLLFAAALENGFDPCHWLSNDPEKLPAYEDWTPANYDGSSGGDYSLPGVLRRSLNIPSVQLYQQLGVAPLQQLWAQLGFSKSLPTGPSVALGSAAASVFEMAKAYAVFANNGASVTPYVIESIETPDGTVLYRQQQEGSRQILSLQTADWLNAMLQQVVDSGTAASLRTRFGLRLPLAGKTGSSQNYADAWFAGYSPALVLVSRVGASLPSIHFNSGRLGSGSALALPLFGHTMAAVQKQPVLRRQFFAPFSYENDLPPCEDYREPTLLDDLIDRMKPSPADKARQKQQKEERRAERREKRKNFIRKWFGD